MTGARSPRLAPAGPDRRPERGQSLVEFALLLPVFMILLLGLLEFGFVFAHHQGLEYATREGARTGAALSNGQDGQNGLPVATTCTRIDDQIIAAVQRVLTGKGSLVQLADVTQIRIYKSDLNGNPVAGSIETWTKGAGVVVDGGTIALQFTRASGSWNPCTRVSNASADGTTLPDAIGVDMNYTYHMTTGLGSMLGWAGMNTIGMTDATVMVLNP